MRSSTLLLLAALLCLLGAGPAAAESHETHATADPAAETPDESVPAEADSAPEMEEPVLEVEPEIEAEPEMAAEPEAEPEMAAEPAAQPEMAAEPEAGSEMAAEPEPDPMAEMAAEPAPVPTTAMAPNGVTLGMVGYDSEGRAGRLHLVVSGDTLWDISEAYLGTPWVWPSIWQDNRGIENPHLIYPGNLIWITDSEMRVVTQEEADALLAGSPAAADPEPEILREPAPAPAPEPVLAAEPRTQRVSGRESVGLVSKDTWESAASVIDAQSDKTMLSQGDRVYIGLGAGDVAPGDHYTVYRMRERVYDPDTGRMLGYHVDILGWIEVEEAREEASLAVIRQSDSEIERGDRVIPREPVPDEIPVLPAPRGVEAKVSFFAQSRTMTGMTDFVYLNRGTLDGVDVGSPLEVYRPAYTAREAARHTRVEVPDRVIAQLLVVKAEANSAVAFVTHTAAEIELGDHVRAATR